MNCKQVETRLVDYLDGKLGLRERQAVETHARGCAHCAERVQGFTDVFSMLDTWKQIEPSPSFNARLAERLEQERTSSQGWWGNLLAGWLPLPAGNLVFALALLMMVSVAAVLVRYSPTPTQTIAQQQPPLVVNVSAADVDDIALYRNLPVLEDLDVLRNFEVLQALNDAGH